MPATTALVDTFGDNSRDTAKWSLGLLWWWGITHNGINETNGRVEVLPPASTTNGGGGYQSIDSYDITGSHVFVRVEPSGSLSTGQEVLLEFGQTGAETGYVVLLDSSTLRLQRRVSGTKTTVASFAYVSATHRWWRIRHNITTDTVHFDTADSAASNPPASGEWSGRATETWNASIPKTGVVSFGSSTWQNVATTRTIMFDGFNTATNGYTIIAEPGSFALTGASVGLLAQRRIVAEPGEFYLTGASTGLPRAGWRSSTRLRSEWVTARVVRVFDGRLFDLSIFDAFIDGFSGPNPPDAGWSDQVRTTANFTAASRTDPDWTKQ